MYPLYEVNALTLRQVASPDHLLGRVNATLHVVEKGLVPFGALAGGALAPVLFGALIGTGKPIGVFYGYLFGAVLMLVTVPVVILFGVAAERKSLESIATPLSAAQQEEMELQQGAVTA